ncbi:DUF6609 family protein [Agromyces archimandritae]|uniref:Transmembrane protein n=1 Tax=Agromyces archimandritae TaxID=2781962 RepID=A0A975IPR1_9MICO|nr:DUF6609 family protein [Agromyces archimandritae]QTX05554.1 hypothetical protein G127AT_04895 [Agromyces archimandritae]
MDLFADMAEIFPLMRGGGGFLVAIGLGILVGTFGGRRWRIVWLIAGAALGIVIMAVGGATKLIFAGLPYPPIWQWVVLGVAFLVEGYLVSVVVRKQPDMDSRGFWMWMLFAVGVHFLILGVSHGPVCAALAIVCMANALIGLRATGVDFRVFWAIDGVLKILAGAGMLWLSYR